MAVGKTQDTSIKIERIKRESIVLNVLGISPLICERMSEKARRDFLLPRGKLGGAERQASLKHDPLEEYRASAYTLPDDSMPTLLAVISSAFKGAMATAAMDVPKAKKAQIGRLVFVEGQYTGVWGKPYLFMAVVRMADISHTPDIRSRAIVPYWACQLKITYATPLLTKTGVTNLLEAAGTIAGIGGWRPEKGKGDYGQFRVVNADDPELLAILKQDRKVQQEALAKPEAFDAETESLLSWYKGEVVRRGRDNGRDGEVPEKELIDVRK